VTAAGTYSGENLVLVKYNSSGAAQWVESVTAGSNYSWYNSVSVATDGSVFAAGYIEGSGTYVFGSGVTAMGPYIGQNIVLVKYNSSGVAQWAQTMIAGSGSTAFTGVSAAPDGSVYAAGEIYGAGSYNLGNGITAAGIYGGFNILLVRYD